MSVIHILILCWVKYTYGKGEPTRNRWLPGPISGLNSWMHCWRRRQSLLPTWKGRREQTEFASETRRSSKGGGRLLPWKSAGEEYRQVIGWLLRSNQLTHLKIYLFMTRETLGFVQLDVDGDSAGTFHEDDVAMAEFPGREGFVKSPSWTTSRVLISMPLEGGMWQYSDSSSRSETSRALCFLDLATSKHNLCMAKILSASSLREKTINRLMWLVIHLSSCRR